MAATKRLLNHTYSFELVAGHIVAPDDSSRLLIDPVAQILLFSEEPLP